jgi:hypothetical protein
MARICIWVIDCIIEDKEKHLFELGQIAMVMLQKLSKVLKFHFGPRVSFRET